MSAVLTLLRNRLLGNCASKLFETLGSGWTSVHVFLVCGIAGYLFPEDVVQCTYYVSFYFFLARGIAMGVPPVSPSIQLII